MTRLWALILGNILPIAVVAILGYLVLTRVGMCKDANDSAEAAVKVAQLQADSAEKARLKAQHSQDSANLAEKDRQLTLALANGTKVLTQWRDSPPATIRTGTAHDSITQLANNVKACRDAGDKLAASVVEIKSSCEAYRDSVKVGQKHDSTRYAQLETSYAHLDSLRNIEKRGKRIQSYGDLLYEPLKQRPVVSLGTTTRLFWNVDGKVEAQYSIPTRTDSAGFRLLAGAHVRF